MKPAVDKYREGIKPFESAASPTSGNAPGRRILLADDSADIRALVVAYLEHTAHHLEIAADGQAAVEQFCARPFDLVLMDVEMPVMDGYSAARAIRQWEARRGAPPAIILALTGGAMDEHEASAGEPACDARLSKPFRMQAFLQSIEEHLKARDVVPVSLSGGIENLVPGYLESRKAEIRILEAALAAADYETIRVLGHHLRGSGTPYGFAALSQIGKSLESAAATRSPDEIQRHLAALGDYLARVSVGG